jgi:hypothetical protein
MEVARDTQSLADLPAYEKRQTLGAGSAERKISATAARQWGRRMPYVRGGGPDRVHALSVMLKLLQCHCA